MNDVVPVASLALSVLTALLGAAVSYAVRHRDEETSRRLSACEAMGARVSAVEVRVSASERDAVHVQADLHAIKRDLAELLRIVRGAP